MSGPNINKAGIVQDPHGMQKAPYDENRFQSSKTLTGFGYFENPLPPPGPTANVYTPYKFWPSTDMGLASLGRITGAPRSGITRIMRINLNDLEGVPTVMPFVAASQATPFVKMLGPTRPVGFELWTDKYKYYRIVKRTISFDIEHKGGFHGDNFMPVSFLSYRYNREAPGAVNIDPFADVLAAPYGLTQNGTSTVAKRAATYRKMQTNPRVNIIDGGRAIAQSFSYGFNSTETAPDATFTSVYGSRTRWSYTFNSSDIADEPTKLELTPNWTLVGATPDTNQWLDIFMTNELPTYGTVENDDAASAPLDIRVAVETTVELRDIPEYSVYFTNIP